MVSGLIIASQTRHQLDSDTFPLQRKWFNFFKTMHQSWPTYTWFGLIFYVQKERIKIIIFGLLKITTLGRSKSGPRFETRPDHSITRPNFRRRSHLADVLSDLTSHHFLLRRRLHRHRVLHHLGPSADSWMTLSTTKGHLWRLRCRRPTPYRYWNRIKPVLLWFNQFR